ncbi:hypothetical protein ABFS82_04G156800 [Erythranthe guttata]
MAGTCIRLMVVALCFSYSICMNGAIPITRSTNLMNKPQSYEFSEGDLLVENPNKKVESTTGGRRIEMELDDYPGSGANNRHTPRPQLGRGCTDC